MYQPTFDTLLYHWATRDGDVVDDVLVVENESQDKYRETGRQQTETETETETDWLTPRFRTPRFWFFQT